MKTGVRLQFEQGVLRTVYQTEREPRRLFPRLVLLAALAGLAVMAAGATHFLRSPLRAKDAESILRMATGVFDALKTSGLGDPPAVCADSETGAAILREDDQRLFKSRKPASGNRRPCMESLLAIREVLVKEGIALEQARPLAFGGVEARIFDAATMNEAARSLTGSLYFSAGDRLYGIELTARRCGDQYVVLDVWNCLPVEAAPADIEAHVKQRYQQFCDEPAKPGEPSIKRARRLFVPL
ncbi:MAG TPA: hypothetical protein PKO36_02500 [Candidatus Hydrogenedentes bacterium]|nr:hypothetical protein [Candidatus Hydrogenedentota bacterium]HOV76008.1 hypothetical protein [Candidatus Hydrogenedentota bacterium]HPC15888.1 hypothetical protein [Candidatus Hydrogenedentota bacterium]HRT19842.1 hypothetical protein [Candidatus Hydrogenedentota bacterium]HRT65422.1 hypothetical protein [Candidatus Hydrogenedentota bacterium]